MIMDIRNCAFFVCFYTKSQESPPSEESKDVTKTIKLTKIKKQYQQMANKKVKYEFFFHKIHTIG